jgi:ATP-dependent helicase HrpB
MLKIPAHPRIARLLLAASGTPLEKDALILAAVLADDSRTAPGAADALVGGRLPHHLSPIRDQFASITKSLPKIGNRQSAIGNPTDLLLLAYPDRVARRRGTVGGDPYAAQLSDGTGARLAPESLTPALAKAPLFLALDAHHDPRNRKAEARVRTAIPLDESALQRLLPEFLRTDTALEYDPTKEKVIAFTRRYYRELLLSEDPHGRVDPARAGEVLAAALAPRAVELFTRDESAAKLLARIALLRHHMPEHPWPALDAPQLRELLAHAASGKRSLAELADSHGLAAAIRSTLAYPLDRLLDQHAPETITVPSGSRIKLEYAMPSTPGTAPPSPTLAVRLQELFGLLDTPRLANGRVPILLHLLSPGFKPIQITADLRSFWSSAYFEVRKDLRVRYPKHKWPENPLTAQPEAKGRRKN